jgi:ssDNA-binding Zn-finger/Zn-ribbon topoisomerase 1
MIVRQARRGPTPGAMFWGCPGFPDCRGTREFSSRSG